MKSSNQGNKLDRRTLEDEHLDTLIRLAFLDIEQEHTERIEERVNENSADMPIVEMDQAYENVKPMVTQRIDREVRKSQRSHFMKHTLPKYTQIAAVVVLVICIGSATAIASIRSVRVRVMELLINIEEKYTELSLVERDDLAFDVPADWKGAYYPSYVPDGFRYSGISDGVDSRKVSFINDQGVLISFTEHGVDSGTNIDTEGADLSYIQVGGNSALVSSKDNATFITWSEFEHYYVLYAQGSELEAIKIAEGMKRIR